MLGKSVIIQLDANSKVGSEFIPKDNHIQSPNGALLGGIITRNNLVLVNGLQDRCTGLITRKRTTVNSVEESIIDFVIVSDDLVQFVDEMIIDENRSHALTGFKRTKSGTKSSESDHMTILTKA